MKNLILVSLFVLGFNHAMWADSPLTSTDISSGYKDVPIVAAALKEGALTEQLMDYLSVSENPIAVKIAIIHALSDAAKATVFFKHINSGNKYRDLSDFTNQASGDLLICMAYLKALENYFDVGEALIMAQSAKHKSPKSYTVHIICALIEAQKAMDGDWCNVYSLTDNVRKNTSLTNDMNDKAKEGIFSYMDLYKEYCNQFALYPKQNADGKYGYVNDAGETVIDYQFDGADDF
ncbi:MAG: hypothetical protein LBR10_14785, partial [Prevotellaceae bacterium]|nr:hypothetical protein [Prevotellaceae bacterium]